ncbi:hypothetical protein Tco_1458146 [Tanacetum coccineum]
MSISKSRVTSCAIEGRTLSPGTKNEDSTMSRLDRSSARWIIQYSRVSKSCSHALSFFPLLLPDSAKMWVASRQSPGTNNTWDLLKKAFIQRNIGSSSSKDELAALVNKLDNLGRDMKKLKESVHAIQVGCQICEGPHLEKDCPLNEELKQVEEDHPGFCTEIDNRPIIWRKRGRA